MKVRTRKGLAAMLAAVGGVGFARHAAAANRDFIGSGASGDNLYSNPANWPNSIIAGDPSHGGSVLDTFRNNGANYICNINSGGTNTTLGYTIADARLSASGANFDTENFMTGALMTVVGDDPTFGAATNTGVVGFELGRSNGCTNLCNFFDGQLSTLADDSTGEVGIGQLVNASGFTTGYLNMQGGTIAVAQNFVVGDQANASFKANGAGTQTGGVIMAGGNAGGGSIVIGNAGNGTYTISAGTLVQVGTGTNKGGLNNGAGSGSNNTNTAHIGFYVGRLAGSTGNMTQSGGTVSISNGLYLADGNNAKGTYTASGGILTIAGEMRVAPSADENAVTLTGNSATFSIVGNSMPTINANSLVADSAGSTLNFSIDSAAGATLLNITPGTIGGVAFDGIAHLSTSTLVDVDNISGFTPGSGTFTLLTATSITALPTLVADGDAFDADQLSIVNNPDGSQSLVIGPAVPEPGSLAAMLLGTLALTSRRRKRS